MPFFHSCHHMDENFATARLVDQANDDDSDPCGVTGTSLSRGLVRALLCHGDWSGLPGDSTDKRPRPATDHYPRAGHRRSPVGHRAAVPPGSCSATSVHCATAGLNTHRVRLPPVPAGVSSSAGRPINPACGQRGSAAGQTLGRPRPLPVMYRALIDATHRGREP